MLAAHKNMNSSSSDMLSQMHEMHGAGANGNDSNSFLSHLPMFNSKMFSQH